MICACKSIQLLGPFPFAHPNASHNVMPWAKNLAIMLSSQKNLLRCSLSWSFQNFIRKAKWLEERDRMLHAVVWPGLALTFAAFIISKSTRNHNFLVRCMWYKFHAFSNRKSASASLEIFFSWEIDKAKVLSIRSNRLE